MNNDSNYKNDPTFYFHHSRCRPLTYTYMNFNTYKIIFYSYSALLVLLSLLPINGEGSALNNNYVVTVRLDYWVHLAQFIPWVLLARLAYDLNLLKFPMKAFGWLLVGVFVATATEFIQYFLPYRSYNVNDLVSNYIGLVLGAALFLTGLPLPGSLKDKR